MTKTYTPAEHARVVDAKGNEIDFEAAVALMDDDIREDLHFNYEAGFDNPQAFLEEYARRHQEKYGEPFAPWDGGQW